MTRTTDAVGAYGERVAQQRLVEAGTVVLDRNWRCATGELDLVGLDAGVIVFCEQRLRDLRHGWRSRARSRLAWHHSGTRSRGALATLAAWASPGTWSSHTR